LHILVIEDQQDIAQNIAEFFEAGDHTLDFATDGKSGLHMALNDTFDIVLLDVNLPQMDGWEVCRQLREQADCHIPILMLTANSAIDDRVKGLQLGADDYLTKPFALRELEARCVTLSRRYMVNQSNDLVLGELSIDLVRKKVTRQGQVIELNQMPYKILLYLAQNHPKIVSRSALCRHLWSDDYNDSDSLRSHIYQLRKSLDKPFEYGMISTVHNVGFTLIESPKKQP
ncbi:MAG: response regulator transcription factor, partial [Algicola sp.]|nr:response regulator transcription factor [Algicola sp.]